MLEKVVGVLFVAVVTAILYVWGLKKSFTQQQDLMQLLSIKGEKKVVRYLKKNDYITTSQIEQEISKLSASQFYSKRKAVVTDTKPFAKALIADMVKKGIVKEEMDRGKKIYRLDPKK